LACASVDFKYLSLPRRTEDVIQGVFDRRRDFKDAHLSLKYLFPVSALSRRIRDAIPSPQTAYLQIQVSLLPVPPRQLLRQKLLAALGLSMVRISFYFAFFAISSDSECFALRVIAKYAENGDNICYLLRHDLWRLQLQYR